MTATTLTGRSEGVYGIDDDFDIEHAVEHAAHLLPSQGPIEVFVHHNTLHAFEDRPFEEAVMRGLRVHGAQPWLPESDYREKVASGRIRVLDLETVLLQDLGDLADGLVATLGTRYALRLAMLQFPLQSGNAAETNWVIAETDSLRRFRREVPETIRTRHIDRLRCWMTERDSRPSVSQPRHQRRAAAADDIADVVAEILPRVSGNQCCSWSERDWEAFALQFLWKVSCNGVRRGVAGTSVSVSSADAVRTEESAADAASLTTADEFVATGTDDRSAEICQRTTEAVNNLMIQFCSAFLDQGFADWELPDRSEGFFATFLRLYSQPWCSPTPWLRELYRETQRISEQRLSPQDSIRESLKLRGIPPDDRDSYVRQMLLRLPGWAGMIRQMETNAEWAVHPAPAGTLTQYLAVRLIAERATERAFAAEQVTGCSHSDASRVANKSVFAEDDIADSFREDPSGALLNAAFQVFQLAQVRGWDPRDLHRLTDGQWRSLLEELRSFSSLERRRLYHRAFEKKYRDDALNAVIAHSRRSAPTTVESTRTETERPLFQVVCCIDDREESFRRHVEEIEPRCETFGIAGFY
ncbi:MAG: DUF2309 family protein, partial [Planctomycetaceae bacterium]|nr:DUF2309 family protein [Planctomycetaceae bacterium]